MSKVRSIILLGDSHTAFMSREPDIMLQNKTSLPPPGSQGSHKRNVDGHEITFIWNYGLSVYKLTESYIVEKLKDQRIQDIVLIINFGCVDIRYSLDKYKNHHELVNKLINIGIAIRKKYNIEVIFMNPIVEIDHQVSCKLFEYFLKKESVKNKFLEPIQILNAIGRDYEPADQWSHPSDEDSEKCVNYMVEHIKRAYG